MKRMIFAYALALFCLVSCSGKDTIIDDVDQGNGTEIISTHLVDGFYPNWKPGKEDAWYATTVNIPDAQTPGENGYDEKAAIAVAQASATAQDKVDFYSVCAGIKLNFQMSGIVKVEMESVDGYALTGNAKIKWQMQADGYGNGDTVPIVEEVNDAHPILTFSSSDAAGFTPGRDYFISILPCNLYGGYRLSLYNKEGLKADYFGVHQIAERAICISPSDLIESDLDFEKPNAPLVEEERPQIDDTTNALLHQYQQNPTEENKQALMDQMGLRYDKVVARKKNKLRELEREAKTPDLVQEMQDIVDEMVENREIRLEQQFLRLIDPRTDDNPADAWLVLRGAPTDNAYIGYAPVTNAEYAAFNPGFVYAEDQADYPVVNVTIADAIAYCNWLSSQDNAHAYRLPTDEEWIFAAGHMPKDVAMNS